jgi:glutamyl-tRNA synthetase
MSVITRFAPSPTGYLHIGGARTALFNWLFARHHGGQCLLRIEDTDRARSTDDAIAAIIDGLGWLGLDFDGDPISQFARRDRHAEIARQMVSMRKAYYCYATAQELDDMREQATANGQPPRYDGRWRDRDSADAPPGVAPTIRLKAPLDGETIIHDAVQGTVTVANAQLDDMVLLRGDGTPTYMLAVVVDDHDMAVTHVIRGDDHLTNSFRQYQIYQAMGWKVPVFAHIPLIHGADGAKLSKRHGALGIDAYRDMGYLPEGLCNYLLRLGWGHGDDEIITMKQAIEWFDLPGIGRAPSRLDLAKLDHVNGHYLHEMTDQALLSLAMPFVEKAIGAALSPAQNLTFAKSLSLLKVRAKNLVELADTALLFLNESAPAQDEKATAIINQDDTKMLLGLLYAQWPQKNDLSAADVEEFLKTFATTINIKIGKLAPVLRATCCGTMNSPPLYDTLSILTSEIVRKRIEKFL